MKVLCDAGAEDDRNISRKAGPRLLRFAAHDLGYTGLTGPEGILPACENALSAAPTRLVYVNFTHLVVAGVPEALAAEGSLEAEDRYVPERAALLCARADGMVGFSEYHMLAGARRRAAERNTQTPSGVPLGPIQTRKKAAPAAR